MDILQNQIDADSILTSLYTKSVYTDLFRSLLRTPTPNLLSKLIMGFPLKMINDLKFLIKNKYGKLTEATQRNINTIALLLLGFGRNVDSIIINLLRIGYNKFPVDHKYFKEFNGTLPFIRFHQTRLTNNSVDYIKLVTTLITYDMERDILFMHSVKSNIKFYIIVFINKYRSKIADILLFIQASNLQGRNVEYLIYNLNIVGKLPTVKGSVACMITDLEREETVVTRHENLNNASRLEGRQDTKVNVDNKGKMNNKIFIGQEISSRQEIPSRHDTKVSKASSPVKSSPSISTAESFLQIISDLSFPKYYSLIQDMKRRGSFILDPKLYKAVVFASFEYDNYVQVYLWKILVYQKILFKIEIEIDENDLKTEEALEGYDIYLNID